MWGLSGFDIIAGFSIVVFSLPENGYRIPGFLEVIKTQYDSVLEKLKAPSDPRAVEGMARFGMNALK